MSVVAKLIILEKSTLKAPLPSIAERHQLPVLMGDDDKHHWRCEAINDKYTLIELDERSNSLDAKAAALKLFRACILTRGHDKPPNTPFKLDSSTLV